MKRSIVILATSAGLLLAACGPSSSRSASAAEVPPTIEGVWKRAEVVVETGPHAGPHTIDVQPSIYVFSKAHYGYAAVEGFTPRSFLGEKPTVEEQGRAFAAFSGSSGSYTSVDNSLTLTPAVATDPSGMTGTPITYQTSRVGRDLWINTATPEGGEVRTRLIRQTEDTTPPTEEARKLQGVWRRAEMIVGTGADAGRHFEDMQPGFYVFTPNYFAANFVSAFAPRPGLSAAPTETEMGTVLGPFASFGGEYAVDGDKLTLKPIVTKDPNNMRGRPFQPIELAWEGSDVWFIYTGSDGTQNRTRLTPVAD